MRIILIALILGLSVCGTQSAYAEKVSWYGNESIVPKWKGYTASGERFNEQAMTCASYSRHDLGRWFKVSYLGKSVLVRCNDTGSFRKYGRRLDLSKGAFSRLASLRKGIIDVKIERMAT